MQNTLMPKLRRLALYPTELRAPSADVAGSLGNRNPAGATKTSRNGTNRAQASRKNPGLACTPERLDELIARLDAPTPFCAPETWTQAGPLWLRAVAGGFCAGWRP